MCCAKSRWPPTTPMPPRWPRRRRRRASSTWSTSATATSPALQTGRRDGARRRHRRGPAFRGVLSAKLADPARLGRLADQEANGCGGCRPRMAPRACWAMWASISSTSPPSSPGPSRREVSCRLATFDKAAGRPDRRLCAGRQRQRRDAASAGERRARHGQRHALCDRPPERPAPAALWRPRAGWKCCSRRRRAGCNACLGRRYRNGRPGRRSRRPPCPRSTSASSPRSGAKGRPSPGFRTGRGIAAGAGPGRGVFGPGQPQSGDLGAAAGSRGVERCFSFGRSRLGECRPVACATERRRSNRRVTPLVASDGPENSCRFGNRPL